jgi:hypothetical protein
LSGISAAALSDMSAAVFSCISAAAFSGDEKTDVRTEYHGHETKMTPMKTKKTKEHAEMTLNHYKKMIKQNTLIK